MGTPFVWNQPGGTWNGLLNGQPMVWNGVLQDERSHKMPKVTLDLRSKSDKDMVEELNTIAAAILAAGADWNNVKPTPAELTGAATTLEAAIKDRNNKQKLAVSATVTLTNQRNAADGLLTDAARWGENNVKDEAKLMKVFKLQKARTPTTSMAQVQGLAITFGDKPGTLDLMWQPDSTAKSYEIQCRYLTNGAPGAWTHAKSVSMSSVTLTGLNTGQVIQLQVRAIGPKGLEGPWSDLAEHLVG